MREYAKDWLLQAPGDRRADGQGRQGVPGKEVHYELLIRFLPAIKLINSD